MAILPAGLRYHLAYLKEVYWDPCSFLFIFNDFPLAGKCNCGLFADDSILHRKVTSEPDCEDLQTFLHSHGL